MRVKSNMAINDFKKRFKNLFFQKNISPDIWLDFQLILGVVIGTIAGISYFLRQAVIDNSVSKKKRRKRSYSLANLILAGKLKKKNSSFRLKFEKRGTGSPQFTHFFAF